MKRRKNEKTKRRRGGTSVEVNEKRNKEKDEQTKAEEK